MISSIKFPTIGIAKLSFAILLILCATFSVAHAQTDSGFWSYVFHLQIKDGVLAQNSDAEFFYDPIPVIEPVSMPLSGEYYAKIVSGKGVTLSTVWFSAPSSIVVAKNKKIMDVSAPFYAYADHVTFYTAQNKELFTVSLRGSSFCNEDSKCNKEVGEDYQNCSMDCVAPPTPPPTFTPPVVAPITPPSIPGEPVTQPVVTGTPLPVEATGGEVTRTSSPVEKQSIVIPLTIGLFLVLTALVGMVYMKKLKNARD